MPGWYPLTVLGNNPVTIALSAAYETRIQNLGKLFTPLAKFAGDTSITLTDGSFNRDPSNDDNKHAQAVLMTTANRGTPGGGPDNELGENNLGYVSCKPLIIKVRRDQFTGEIIEYGVFNADGTWPGCPDNERNNHLDYNPFGGANARYKVNMATGEIYLNNKTGIAGIDVNNDGDIDNSDIKVPDDNPNIPRIKWVVGIVDFEPLKGAALSYAQEEQAELSGVIQSLTALIRAQNDQKKGLLSVIR